MVGCVGQAVGAKLIGEAHQLAGGADHIRRLGGAVGAQLVGVPEHGKPKFMQVMRSQPDEPNRLLLGEQGGGGGCTCGSAAGREPDAADGKANQPERGENDKNRVVGH